MASIRRWIWTLTNRLQPLAILSLGEGEGEGEGGEGRLFYSGHQALKPDSPLIPSPSPAGEKGAKKPDTVDEHQRGPVPPAFCPQYRASLPTAPLAPPATFPALPSLFPVRSVRFASALNSPLIRPFCLCNLSATPNFHAQLLLIWQSNLTLPSFYQQTPSAYWRHSPVGSPNPRSCYATGVICPHLKCLCHRHHRIRDRGSSPPSPSSSMSRPSAGLLVSLYALGWPSAPRAHGAHRQAAAQVAAGRADGPLHRRQPVGLAGPRVRARLWPAFSPGYPRVSSR